MKDTTKAALAAGVAAGYILGRTKKGRLAFAMATFLAGRRLGLDPQQLLAEGAKKLKDAPQVADLGQQVRDELLGAARQALKATADRSLGGLADSLHERTQRLGAPLGATGDDEESEEEPEDEEAEDGEPEDEELEDEEPEDEPEQEPKGKGERGDGEQSRRRTGQEAPAKRATAKKGSEEKSSSERPPAAKRSAKKPTPKDVAQEAPLRTAAGKDAPARKSAPSRSDSRRR